MSLAHGPDEGVCASRGCENPATIVIAWHNPANPRKRTKEWFSCDDHEESFMNYLTYRAFPYEIRPYTTPKPLS
ncbi:hypothetical protein G7Y41_05270 [Schaalia sp. ZJ405]|uniref:hypothetical protein n=1 Tax=unclassified Schaalia TaxID=2691889 RepID=UPI0013ED8B90|nr:MULTISPECIES: hypothetical protein [unclassified Schaalia]QPK80528.1 hypothetical protein G7Y41_05270 [Schaalia sp. ZJ405]